MAIRNIVKEGDPILNKVCRPVTNFDDRLATLLDDMRETMIAADGVGPIFILLTYYYVQFIIP